MSSTPCRALTIARSAGDSDACSGRGSQTLMIGQTLWTEFFANRDWPIASALAVVLLAVLLGPILLYQRRESRALEQR